MMRVDNEGIALWYGTPDAPAPAGAIEATPADGAATSITVGVAPQDPSNRVQVRYRVNGGPAVTAAAVFLHADGARQAQYFRAWLPRLQPGDHVDYTPVCHRVGRQVPAPEQAAGYLSSFTVAGQPPGAMSEGPPGSASGAPVPSAAAVPAAVTAAPAVTPQPVGLTGPGLAAGMPWRIVPVAGNGGSGPVVKAGPGKAVVARSVPAPTSNEAVPDAEPGVGSAPRTLVSVSAPAPGAQVGRTLTVKGSAGLDPSTVGSHQKLAGRPSVTITFNDLAPAEGTLSVQPNGLWQLAGATVPASISDGSALVISVAAQAAWFDDRDQGHEPHDADPGGAEVSVQLETRPPELTITPDYPADVVTATLPFEADIHGTTSGGQSGITGVSVSVDQGPETSAVDTSPGHDWSIWRAHLSLTADDHQFTVTARDSSGRSAAQSGSISVHQSFEQSDPAIVFGMTVYVRELTDFARQFVQIPGESGGPDRAALAGVFHQPYDRIQDPQVFAAATAPVDQRRVAVEVLRGSLTAPVPASTDQRLRGLAYEALLRQLGTSTPELRLARIAGQAQRQVLAARLGIDLEGPRPDRLDLLTFSPEEITDAQLEATFGFRAMTGTDPFAPITALPTLQAWRQASQRSRWQAEDVSTRDGGDPPLPVIDPDHVLAANLAVQHDGDPAHDLWATRQAFVDGLAGQIDESIAQGNRTLATFEQLVATHIGPIDVPAVAGRDADGEDVSDVLGPVRLGLDAFRYLAGARALLSAGSLLTSEWTALRDVLVQVHKRREFPGWRQEERAADIVLQPQQFVADPPPAPAGLAPAPPSAWRADQQMHLDWQRTLQVRAVELDRLQGDLQAVVQAAEAAVLPVARDEIIAVIGSRQAPPEQPQATAERLTRQLCIDLLADSAALTTRADQAAQTLLEALFSLRSGRLAISTSGQAWSIGQEALFDAKWEWLGSYQTWYAAITSFAYPENHLFPGLYLPDGLSLKPTGSYTQFLGDLRAARITPQRARQLAADNLDRVLGTINDQLHHDLHDTFKRLAPATEEHTNAQLDNIRITLAPLFGVSADTDQLVRELFWLVPVALGLALTDAGDFVPALDWYACAYAYQLPADVRRIFPGLAAEHTIQSTFDRPETWPVDGSNPHEVARHRADAYTRFTVLSIARCLLAYGDNEFIRATAASNAQARALYEAALDLLQSPDAASLTGDTVPFPPNPVPFPPNPVPFPPNPVQSALQTQAQTTLGKIHQGLNIASTLPERPAGRACSPASTATPCWPNGPKT